MGGVRARGQRLIRGRRMPYLLISTQIRLETGPTLCGDEATDPKLMSKVAATLEQDSGKKFKLWVSQLAPRVVLNRLEAEGYRVVASSGVGQSCIWTLFKEF